MAFETNIFINCPFDKEYKPILKSIIFCIVYLNHEPLISETLNAAETRIHSIQNLIENSLYSIHDLSRMQATKKNELARFNMPFELGMDIGCKRFGTDLHRTKCLLILDQESYRYQKAISDLAGNDIARHNNEPEKAVRQIRNWLKKITQAQMASASTIWNLYNEFITDFQQIAIEDNLSIDDIDEMPWEEYCNYIRAWLSQK